MPAMRKTPKHIDPRGRRRLLLDEAESKLAFALGGLLTLYGSIVPEDVKAANWQLLCQAVDAALRFVQALFGV